MSLRTQLLLLILIPLLCAGGGLWGALQTYQAANLVERGAASTLRISRELNDFILFLQEPPPGKTAQYQLQATRNRIDTLTKPPQPLFNHPAERPFLDTLGTAQERLSKQLEQARRAGGGMLTSRHAALITQELRSLLQAADGLSAFYASRLQAAHKQSSRLNLILLAVALGWPIAISVLLYRTLAHPLRQLTEAMAAVAKGSFSYRLASPPGEFGLLATAFNKMVEARQRSEETAREAEARLKSIYQQLPLPIVNLDPNGAISDCNDCLLLLAGRSRHEVIGKNWFELFVPDPEPAKQRFSTMLAGSEQTARHQDELVTKDGTQRLMAWHSLLTRDAGGTVDSSISIGYDITEQRATEQNLQQQTNELRRRVQDQEERLTAQTHEMAELQQQLTAAREHDAATSRSKDAFLATVSRELRTPLSTILGLTQLTLQTDLTGKQLDYLQTITNSAQHLLGTINNLSDYAKLETGQLQIEQSAFSLGDVINRVMDVATALANGRPLNLTPIIAEGVPDDLLGDPLRLEQVLVNLLSNAITFTEQGQITLRVASGVTSRDTNQVSLSFSVQDSGCGMDEQTMARLYQPFSQTGDPTSPSTAGPGLGLTISKRLVTMMGGQLTVASKPGSGSTFTFSATFGLGKRKQRTPPRAVPAIVRQPHNLRGYRLLVVDDHAINLQIARELLESWGMTAETAVNGAEAVAIVQDHGTELAGILMDIQMPVMDGYEATRQIRHQFSAQQLPIIAMTAHVFDEDRERCLAAGMNDHLPKPLALKPLHALLCKHVGICGQQAPGNQHSWDDEAPPLPEQLPGIDRNALLTRVNHNQQLSVRLIRLFASEHHAIAQEIKQRMQESDLPAAARLAHGIKGVAGNLAALTLQRSAAALEEALKKNDRAAAGHLLTTFEQALDEVCGTAALLSGIRVEPPSANAELSAGDLTTIIRQLHLLLQSHDLQAAPCAAQLRHLLSDNDGLALAGRLSEAIERLDYSGAEQLLQQLAAQREIPLVEGRL